MRRVADSHHPCLPMISLCMIVKDEEGHLPRCLGSIRNWVDEIVLVDTGSTDGTVEIAQSFGARIFHHPWENDFSKHRNQSLSYARGDWILVLDADEEVEREDAPGLRGLLGEAQAQSLFLPVTHVTAAGRKDVQHNSVRLFRNRLGFHYRGIVHNRLVLSGPSRFAAVRVYHYGYGLAPDVMTKKFARTTRLLKRELEVNPEDALSHYYLGVAYLGQGDFTRAYEEGQTAKTLVDKQRVTSDHVQEIYWLLESAAFNLGRLGEMELFGLEAIQRFPQHVDSYCLLSSLYWTQDRLPEFLSTSVRYLELLRLLAVEPESFGTVGLFTERVLWKVHVFRAVAWSRLGEEKKSEMEIRLAEETAGSDPECYRILGGFLAERGQERRARIFFRKALGLDPADSIAREALKRLEKTQAASKVD